MGKRAPTDSPRWLNQKKKNYFSNILTIPLLYIKNSQFSEKKILFVQIETNLDFKLVYIANEKLKNIAKWQIRAPNFLPNLQLTESALKMIYNFW